MMDKDKDMPGWLRNLNTPTVGMNAQNKCDGKYRFLRS